MANVYAFLTLFLGAGGYAFARGGAPERMMAGLFLFGMCASKLVMMSRERAFAQPELTILAIDLLMVGIASIIALKAERLWTIAAAAALLAGAQLQIGVMLAPVQYHQVYRICHAVSGYLTLILLIAGTWRHQSRLRTRGDRDWTIFGETR